VGSSATRVMAMHQSAAFKITDCDPERSVVSWLGCNMKSRGR
jgi:hypothetical protein